jgi:hypothetical protein
MYACNRETRRRFFEGRAHPDTRGLISTTHPHHHSRELTSASPSKGERGSQYILRPVHSIR